MGGWEKWRSKNVGNGGVEKGLLSRKDAAEYLGVGLTTFDKYVALHGLKSYALPPGRLKKFRVKDLEDFISNLGV